jgi:LytS/YehU family sensor histidine kinase
MTLQPLVENSLKYGVGARIDGGRVEIRAVRSGDTLILDVLDDGPGFSPTYSDGTGLGNLRRRLDALYGDPYGIEIIPGEGAHVRVRTPFVERDTPEPGA